MDNKTNAIRLLNQLKIDYQINMYDNFTNGVDVALALNENPAMVFKTLVTVGKSKKNYVFMISVDKELDLKLAAKSTFEKSIEMVKAKDLLVLTGYIHGGCSPIGMKKFFPTFIDESVKNFDEFYFSGGRIGIQLKMKLTELEKVIKFNICSLTK